MSATRSSLNTTIRWMIRRDMLEVLEIESQCFEYPWSEEDFIRYLRQRNCIGMVAEAREVVHGFMVYELHKRSLNVLNLAVHPSSHGLGIGRLMIKKLVSKLSLNKRNRLTIPVRESNTDALLFLKAMGLRAVNVYRDYYDDIDEDMILMVYRVREEAVL